tara:strand:+ start:689 stop:2110 length:1422 start_codon:yes stop_codon:yes gene_type:complete
MAATSNNSGFSIYTGAPFGETAYRSTSLVDTYIDPANKSTKSKTSVETEVNITTGDIELYHKLPAEAEKISLAIFKADGSKVIPDSSKFNQFFDPSQPHTSLQLDKILDLATTEGLVNAKIKLDNVDYEALASSELYKSKANSSSTNVELGNASVGQGNAAYEAKAVPTGKKLLRYPLSIPDLGYDFIKITAYKYIAGGRQSLKLGERQSAKERLLSNNSPLETIILPMQPNFSESNAVQWGGDNLDPLKMMGAQFASGAIQAIGNIGTPQKSLDIIGDTFTSLGEDISAILSDEKSGPALVAYFAGQAVGANILGRSAGVTLNPNLELLFKGPNLRTFAFNFRFTPRSAKESEEVKQIIRVFKKNMAVQRSTSNLFLLTPNIFTVEYIYNAKGENAGQQHPYLNIFKPMAMTNLNVNYTPDGTYMTYNETGSLTSYDLQMSFGEIEPIYADEYDSESDSDVGRFNDHRNMGY